MKRLLPEEIDFDDAVADVTNVLLSVGVDGIAKECPRDSLVELLIYAVDEDMAEQDEFRQILSSIEGHRLSRGEFRRRRKTMKSYISTVDSYPCLREHVGPQGLFVEIKCNKCGKTDNKRLKAKDISPEHVLLPGWRKAGWDIRKKGKEATCPSCIGSRAPSKPMEASLLEQQAARENERRRRQAEKEAMKPELKVVPEPVKNPSYPIEFKRRIVEECETVPMGQRKDFLDKEGLSWARYGSWKRAYLEGRLGKLDVVLSMRSITKPFNCVGRRTFSEQFCKTVVEEISKLSDTERAEYLKNRALTNTLVANWKLKYTPTTTTTPRAVAVDPKTQFQLFQLLQDPQGYDDEHCAQELGLEVQYVARVRKEVFGEATNPEIEDVRQQIAQLQDKLVQDVGELRDLAQALQDDLERQIEALSDRLMALERSS